MSKLFLCDYHHYGVVKCHRNMNFEEMNTEASTGKKWWISITMKNI